MEYYCGIDVSLEQSSVCVVDAEGLIVREATVASDPEALIVWFSDLGLPLSRIGLEAGPLSQWLYAGLATELLETRHVRDAFKAMPIKTDKKDARDIAQLMVDGVAGPIDRLVSACSPGFLWANRCQHRKYEPCSRRASWCRPSFMMSRSGEKDVSGRISKIGDLGVRAVLYEAAHIILTRPVKAGAQKAGPYAWLPAPARTRPRLHWLASSR